MTVRLPARLKQVAPSPGSLAVYLPVFAFFEGLIRYLETKNVLVARGLPFGPGSLLLVIASIGLGLWRIFAFHPVWSKGYATWLQSTPWTKRKALPLGPVKLIWEDGLTVGALLLLSATVPQPQPMRLLCAFLLSYLSALTSLSGGAPAIGAPQARSRIH